GTNHHGEYRTDPLHAARLPFGGDCESDRAATTRSGFRGQWRCNKLGHRGDGGLWSVGVWVMAQARGTCRFAYSVGMRLVRRHAHETCNNRYVSYAMDSNSRVLLRREPSDDEAKNGSR